MNAWLVIAVALAYIGLLFAFAFYGDARARVQGRAGSRPVIYALSLAVYCSSWTFFGTVGTAGTRGWDFVPIYLGPILALTAFYPVLKKLVRVSKRHNITSIADFIASRYGKSQYLAALVCIMAVVAILPYIALQLKGVATAFDILTIGPAHASAGHPHALPFNDFPFYLALALAAFAMLFGTRHVDTSESHQGIIYAIAFESLVKLSAFLAVGLFVTFGLFNGFGDLFSQAGKLPEFSALFAHQPVSASFTSILFLSMAAMVCLPRQFHVGVVENTEVRDLRTARWLFPLYLGTFAIFVMPIAAAGLVYFGDTGISPDRFVLALPMANGADVLALFAFVGGFSAGTSMVIMATVALSTMVCNDLIMPALMRIHALNLTRRRDLSGLLLWIRRGVILALLLTAYGYYRYFAGYAMLSSIGLLSFAGCLQFLPAIVGGLYFKGVSRRGVVAGLIVGFCVWAYTLVVPYLAMAGLLPASLLQTGPLQIGWLKPHALLGLTLGGPITHGAVWSLVLNIVAMVVVSLLTSRNLLVRGQAGSFVESGTHLPVGYLPVLGGNVTVRELEALVARFLGVQAAQRALSDYDGAQAIGLRPGEPAAEDLRAYCERLLAGVIGGSSARLVLASAMQRRELGIADVVELIDGTAAAVQFNRTLLQAAINNIDQGVSVIDQDLRLVAWNKRYAELFDYPRSLLQVGRPVAELIRYNAGRGICGQGGIEAHISKRIGHLRKGTPHVSERILNDGVVLDMRGNPMPDGGYVTTFNDITEYKHNVAALHEMNETLEQRVSDRTAAISRINDKLRQENRERALAEAAARGARDEAEIANQSKTRFLAAVSHDLMQPLHAARLFASALTNRTDDALEAGTRIEQSLRSAEQMVNGLRDISRLDAQAWEVQPGNFCIDELLQQLAAEFGPMASERGLALRVVSCSAVVCSDRSVLRRILQNFLTNALRYTPSGRIVLGCRRLQGAIRVEVWDTGPGIPESEQGLIFEEFHRLKRTQNLGPDGLGLGLAIARRMASLLDHPLGMRSVPGRGTVFTITVARGQPQRVQPSRAVSTPAGMFLRGLSVLCIDDDPQALDALQAVLHGWSCGIVCARGRAQLADAVMPDIVLCDYRLHGEADGLRLIGALRARWQQDLPAILITGERDGELPAAARQAGVGLLYKPVRPAALRAMVTRILQQGVQSVGVAAATGQLAMQANSTADNNRSWL